MKLFGVLIDAAKNLLVDPFAVEIDETRIDNQHRGLAHLVATFMNAESTALIEEFGVPRELSITVAA